MNIAFPFMNSARLWLALPFLACAALLPGQAAPGKTQQLSSPDEVPEGLAKSDWSSIRAAYMAGQEATLKAGNNGGATADRFGHSVAVSGDTVVVGAIWEDSSTTGVGSTANQSASNAGAAYVFVRSGTTWSQQAYLKPAAVGSSQAGDQFGQSVAVSGDTVVVGAYLEDSSTLGVNSTPNQSAGNAGAAYVFARSAGVWTQEAYLKPAAVGTTQANDRFGYAVAVSGDTVVVGAYSEDSNTTGVQAGAGTPNESTSQAGAAYVFVRSAGVWTQQAFLKPAAIGTTQEDDWFGYAVAVSGDTVVVGAINEDSGTTGVNSTANESAANAGAAYVFVRTGTAWSQQAYLKPATFGSTQTEDQFGRSVAVSGDTVVVGAMNEDSSTMGVASTANESATDAGAAYVFVRSGAVWSQQAYLKPGAVSITQDYDQFGTSVAISGDTVVVGVPYEDSSTSGVQAGAGTPNDSLGIDGGSGAACLYVRSGAAWSQQAYAKAGNTPIGPGAGDQFGASVAVSGDTVVVGAPAEDSRSTGVNSTPDELATDAGAAYIFVRSAGVWSQQAYLKPAAVGTTQVGDYFGTSVAISGDTVVVGAFAEDSGSTGVNSTPGESATSSGAAYVFTRSAGVWSQQAYLKPAAIGSTQAFDYFGYSVAVSGDTVVVGAFGESSLTTGVNSTPNESALLAGAAYVFVRSTGVWSQQAYLKPAVIRQVGSGKFGHSVAISGDTLAVGAPGEDSSSTGVNSTPNEDADDAGAAYVFVRSGEVWSQQAYLKPAAVGITQAWDQFGYSVSVSGDTVVVGAPGEYSSTTGVNSTPNEDAGFAGGSLCLRA